MTLNERDITSFYIIGYASKSREEIKEELKKLGYIIEEMNTKEAKVREEILIKGRDY